MFDRAFKRVNTFEDFRTKLVEGKEKRAGTELVHETTKKQKGEDDKETIELKGLMEIDPDKEEATIDVVPLAVKSPTIGDLKTMFEPHIEDEVRKLQQGYKVLKKKYPLTQLTLSMMLEKKLQIDYESEMTYQLLKSILKQLKNSEDLVLLMNFKENMLSVYYCSCGINKKLLLVDDDGKTLPKVVSTENTESDSEVEELARTMEETKQDDDYDPFDDDLYDSHDMSDNL
ncbi:hypothetical protein Tco_1237544 [Tanacetum coccineum]